MSSYHWPNSSPLPPSPRQDNPRIQSTPPTGRLYNGHGLNLYDSQYAAYAPGPMFNPYASTTPDPRVPPAQTSSNFRNMNSRALVAAALAPSSTPVELQSHGQNTPNRASRLPQTSSRSQPDVGVSSSPLTEPPEETFTSDSERNTHRVLANKRKRPNKKRRYSQVSDADDDYVEDVEVKIDDGVTKSRKTRPTKGRKLTRQQASSDEDIVLPTPPKKAIRKTKIPTKRLIRKKPQGVRVPETLDEANDADRMMWFWKNSGRDWEDIRIEWARLTGVKPGKSSLSVRYIKLNENFARNGAAGDLELIKYRNEAIEELMTGLWDKVAEKMLAFHPLSEHNPRDLKRRYELLERSGYDIAKVLADDAVEQQERVEEALTHPDDNTGEKIEFNLAQPYAGEAFSGAVFSASALPDTTFPINQAYNHNDYHDHKCHPAHSQSIQTMESSRIAEAGSLPVSPLSGLISPTNHGVSMFDTGTVSGQENFSRTLLDFAEEATGETDTHYQPISLREDATITTPADKDADTKEQSSLGYCTNQHAAVTARAASASAVPYSTLVMYESDSD